MRVEHPPYSFASAFEVFFHKGSGAASVLNREAFDRLIVEYRPWHKFHHAAKELGLDPETAWINAKVKRAPQMRWFRSLVRDEGGCFGVNEGRHLFEPLHRIDRATGGGGAAALEDGSGSSDSEIRRRYRIQTLMDEAAESSILEGAASTRKDAVDMLRAGRSPKNKHERMIVNNYAAMQRVKQLRDKPLDLAIILELHRLLTDGTLDAGEIGRFRRSDERVRVVDDRDGTDIFVPPDAARVPAHMQALCDFANASHAGDTFLHPIVKASVLHFLLGYIHPFTDGNGRTARALFYWLALRHGYSIFEYLSISTIIRKGYVRYPQAFVDVETDDGDATYFVLYQLDVIEQALDRLAEQLAHEEKKIKLSERLLKLAKDLNLRQRLLLEHALRHPLTHYTVKSHANSNGIVLTTARTDLEHLVRLKLMATVKRGKEVVYMATPKLMKQLAQKGLV